MEKLLYESKGSRQYEKFAKKYRGMYVVLIVCGVLFCILFLVLPKYLRSIIPSFFWLIMIAGVFLGPFMMAKNAKNAKKFEQAQIKIYENHIEGVQVNPRVDFSLKYEEIFDVQIADVFVVKSLVIKTQSQSYVAVANDVDLAYAVINKRMEELEIITEEGEEQNYENDQV